LAILAPAIHRSPASFPMSAWSQHLSAANRTLPPPTPPPSAVSRVVGAAYRAHRKSTAHGRLAVRLERLAARSNQLTTQIEDMPILGTFRC
jgi:hypothetical protein